MTPSPRPAGSTASPILWTIGHSDHGMDRLFDLLREHAIEEIVDVRSVPRSRWVPWFDRDALAGSVAGAGLRYRHDGTALGGRPTDASHVARGRADYAAMAHAPAFATAMSTLRRDAATRRVAAMCSERDPATCHRCLLVGRAAKDRGLDVLHILADGRTVSQAAIEDDLLATHAPEADLLEGLHGRIDRSYAAQAGRHAHRLTPRRGPATGAT